MDVLWAGVVPADLYYGLLFSNCARFDAATLMQIGRRCAARFATSIETMVSLAHKDHSLKRRAGLHRA